MKKTGVLFLLTLAAFLVTGVAPIHAQPIVLTLSDQNPDTGWGPVHATQPWVKKVEEVTKGRVKIQIYPNQTLAKGDKNWTAARDGICDMSWNAMTFYSGMAPLVEVLTLPGLPTKTSEESSELAWKAYTKFPKMQEELKDNHVLVLFTTDPFFLLSSKKQVKTLEDIKGMKIRTVGGPIVDAVRGYGATPMAIPMPDSYIAMQRGTVDGMQATWESLPAFRLYEVGKYVTDNVPFAANYFSIVMNKKKWASLPKDIQDAITSVSGLEGSKWHGRNYFDSAKEGAMKVIKEKGYEVTTYTISNEERAKWMEAGVKKVHDDWLKRMEDKGYKEAREVLDFVMKGGK